MLNEKLQFLLFVTSSAGMIFVFKLVKDQLLTLKYSFLWLLMGAFSVVLSVFPDMIDGIYPALGFQLGSNALFLLGIYFLLFIAFSLTVIVSKHSRRMRRLNQEVALLRKQVEDMERDGHTNL